MTTKLLSSRPRKVPVTMEQLLDSLDLVDRKKPVYIVNTERNTYERVTFDLRDVDTGISDRLEINVSLGAEYLETLRTAELSRMTNEQLNSIYPDPQGVAFFDRSTAINEIIEQELRAHLEHAGIDESPWARFDPVAKLKRMRGRLELMQEAFEEKRSDVHDMLDAILRDEDIDPATAEHRFATVTVRRAELPVNRDKDVTITYDTLTTLFSIDGIETGDLNINYHN